MVSDKRSTIFLSWSKDQARSIAKLLKAFLEDVLGTPEVFLSQEIDVGRRWSAEIAEALDRSQAGVIIVTPENVREPWLYFGAGAVSKNTEVAHVVPLLWRISVGDLAGSPLTQFQARPIEEQGLRDLCQTLGTLAGVSEDVVQRRFSTNWPRLAVNLERIPSSAPVASPRPPQLADLMSQLEYLGSKVENVERLLDEQERRRRVDSLDRWVHTRDPKIIDFSSVSSSDLNRLRKVLWSRDHFSAPEGEAESTGHGEEDETGEKS